MLANWQQSQRQTFFYPSNKVLFAFPRPKFYLTNEELFGPSSNYCHVTSTRLNDVDTTDFLVLSRNRNRTPPVQLTHHIKPNNRQTKITKRQAERIKTSKSLPSIKKTKGTPVAILIHTTKDKIHFFPNESAEDDGCSTVSTVTTNSTHTSSEDELSSDLSPLLKLTPTIHASCDLDYFDDVDIEPPKIMFPTTGSREDSCFFKGMTVSFNSTNSVLENKENIENKETNFNIWRAPILATTQTPPSSQQLAQLININDTSFKIPFHVVLDIEGTLLHKNILRPHVEELIELLFTKFTSVSLWTMHSQQWVADTCLQTIFPLVDKLFKQNKQNKQVDGSSSDNYTPWMFRYIWSSDKNELHDGGVPGFPLKDLTHLYFSSSSDMNSSNTLFVDNNSWQTQNNPQNAILVSTFQGDLSDTTLKSLACTLEKVGCLYQKEYVFNNHTLDVRDALKIFFPPDSIGMKQPLQSIKDMITTL